MYTQVTFIFKNEQKSTSAGLESTKRQGSQETGHKPILVPYHQKHRNDKYKKSCNPASVDGLSGQTATRATPRFVLAQPGNHTGDAQRTCVPTRSLPDPNISLKFSPCSCPL
ncbi:hypothetical protein RUM43_004571 [Polyplax serrata]|uniref:Uncharacterized protein n=1 Tax=Polyplax serrata TaxID=468196 RepID=A0AAN8SAZ8_POLSC